MEPFSEQELGTLIRVSWIVLIPAGVLLSMVLYKLAMLLHALLDLATLARYELTPAMRDLRLTAEHMELLSAKAVSGVKSVEAGVAATGPAIGKGVDTLKAGVESLWAGLKQSFHR